MTIKIGEGEYNYTRPLLKQWLAINDLLVKLNKSIKENDATETAKYCVVIVSTSLSIPIEKVVDRPWYEVAIALSHIQLHHRPRYEFPFLNTNIKHKKEIWDYEDRTWYIWSHLFAQKYGWTLEYIANLDVDDAIGLAQEIAVEEQLKKEWEWIISEIAYQSKDGFKELPRPDWMLHPSKPPTISTVKIRKEFMPVGNVIRYKANEFG
jgi:hypothetical protein